MFNLQDRLQPRENEVAAKVMDGEAIIINLANGIYYSIDKAGGLVWEMIEGNYSLEEMIATVVARYEVLKPKAEADIHQLIDELDREHLIMLSNNGARSANKVESPQPAKLPYETPMLQIYRDMGDLLALDPPIPGLAETPWKDASGGEPDK